METTPTHSRHRVVSASPSLAPTAAKPLREDWHRPNGDLTSFLPLLRAANVCTGSSPVLANPLGNQLMTSQLRSPLLPVEEFCGKRRRELGVTTATAATRELDTDGGGALQFGAASEGESDHYASTHSTTEEEVVPVVKRKKKRGYRKATHTIRKEETERLRVELAQLEARMAELQRRAFAPSSDEDSTEDKCLNKKVLDQAVRKQQETFVEVQSVMTSFAACNIQAGSPIQREINLSRDEASRRKTLRMIKALKIQDARDFFSRRLSHLSPLKSMSEDYRFENHEGDYWAVRFATSQFEPAKSVKQVFDLVVYYLRNIEISVSEKLGHLTVREDDDSSNEPGITQNRLVSDTGKGLRMESNIIVFSEYHEPGPGEHDGYGVICSDFVDKDERHPYRPNARIRKDMNTVMEVRSCPRRGRRPKFLNEPDENVVVLTRWSHSRLRHPNFPVRKDGWYELRENMDRWSQNMHKTVMESLDPSTQGPPNWRIDP